MAVDDGDRIDQMEIIDLGRPAQGSARRRGARRVGWLLAAAALTLLVLRLSPNPAAAPSSGSVSPSDSGALPSPSGPAPLTVFFDPPPGGITPGWVLYARAETNDRVLRLELASGTVTVTAVPQLGSTGAVSLVPTRGQVIVRPRDVVAGYVVPDGGPARIWSTPVSTAGNTFPGPDPDHVWVETDDAHRVLRLVRLDGTPTDTTITLPAGASAYDAIPDGRGGIIYWVGGVAFVADAAATSRIANPGTLVAVGPTGWLLDNCGDGNCPATLVYQDDRTHIDVSYGLLGQFGSISPDGRYAAIVVGLENGGRQLVLLGLTTNSRILLSPELSPNSDAQIAGLQWSPDGAWLAYLTDAGALVVVKAATGSVPPLGVTLPRLRGLVNAVTAQR